MLKSEARRALHFLPMLRLDAITKSFGDFTAVDRVSLSLDPGEIVGLVGENGAGKSTLMRIVAGELTPTAGRMEIDGRPALFPSAARDAAARRIEMVHQHFMLVEDFTIAENLALASGDAPAIYSPATLVRKAREIIERSGIALHDPSRRVSDLSVGERSKLELIKALSRTPRILILDEPTSVLTPSESTELFAVMRRVAAGGSAVIFISHKIPEILRATDRVIVMRRGSIVSGTMTADTNPHDLATAMVGIDLAPTVERDRAWSGTRDRSPVPGRWLEDELSGRPDLEPGQAVVLNLSNVSTTASRSVALRGINLNVARGEIVALIGVAGNGQSEIAAMLRGLIAPQSGTIEVSGKSMRPADLLGHSRIAHIPADRTRDGVIAEMTIAENLGLALPRWQPGVARGLAARQITAFSIAARGPDQRVGALSGGNQQKVVLARELGRQPSLIVASDPTRGLDITATRFVQQRLVEAAAAGAAVLLISSDLDEAFALADALHVVYRGAISRRLLPAEAVSEAPAMMAGVE